LTAGQAGDAPEGRRLIGALVQHHGEVTLLMDGATRTLAQAQGLIPVIPSNPRRKQPWQYDNTLYKRRNNIERLFRRLKAWRRVFTRYEA